MHIPDNILLRDNGQYCKRIFKDGITFYYCDSCKKTFYPNLRASQNKCKKDFISGVFSFLG